eukprot:Pompholyxophrys_punicea_v1_NODE_229_length_2670_cov_9.980880.p1 type:complete len:597 gc:universal NODE_229_length_2670_cov_9.980880:2649-859(-)
MQHPHHRAALSLLTHPYATCTGHLPTDLRLNVSGTALTLIHMNIRSLPAHLPDLQVFLHQLSHPWHIIALSEIWSNKIDLTDSLLPGYLFVSCTRDRTGGGVGLFLRNDLHYERLPVRFPGCENLAISCMFPSTKRKCTVIVIYRPPNQKRDAETAFLTALASYLASLGPNENILLAGDLNYDLLTLKPTDAYFELLSQFDMSALITLPTRLTPSSSTLIDHLMLNSYFYSESGTIPCYFSDHEAIFASVQPPDTTPKLPHSTRTRLTLDYRKYSPESLCASLAAVDWKLIPNEANINKALSLFLDTLHEATDQFTRRSSPPASPKKSWISYSLLCEINRTHELRAIAQASKNAVDLSLWKSSRRAVQKRLRYEKRAHILHLLNQARTSTSKTWKILNELRGKPRMSSSLPQQLTVNGSTLDSPLEVASYINSYFASIGTSTGLHADAPSLTADLNSLGSGPAREVPTFALPCCTAEDVAGYISELKDLPFDALEVHPRFLKDGSCHLAPLIANLINLSFSSCAFPDILKVARLVPVFKKGARKMYQIIDQFLSSLYSPNSLKSTLTSTCGSTWRLMIYGVNTSTGSERVLTPLWH